MLTCSSDCERDAALGNGGLGRLAACYLDSSASTELPVWGYGLRYKYGIFQQLIAPDGSQLEAPDPWLNNTNPWELPRTDVTIDIRFYGHAERVENGKAIWSGGQEVLALAYDVMIPGYHTKTVVSIVPEYQCINMLIHTFVCARTTFDYGRVSQSEALTCNLSMLATMNVPFKPPTLQRILQLFSTRMITRWLAKSSV